MLSVTSAPYAERLTYESYCIHLSHTFVLLIPFVYQHPDQWDEVLAEHETDVLVSVSATDLDKMLIVYQRDVKHILELHELGSGRLLREIPLPDLGCVDVQSKRRHSNFFYRFTSFSHPGSIFCMDLAMSKEPVLFKQVVVPDHEPNDYVADQVRSITCLQSNRELLVCLTGVRLLLSLLLDWYRFSSRARTGRVCRCLWFENARFLTQRRVVSTATEAS